LVLAPKDNCGNLGEVHGESGGRAQERTGDPCYVNAVLIPLLAYGSSQNVSNQLLASVRHFVELTKSSF
jgi:hypothetical protein